jgi:Lon protease-like protein
MGWFDQSRSAVAGAEVINIALFPLNTVLFPGGILPLRLFEQRYLDMAAACMKESKPFGICLIEQGKETGSAASPQRIGTLAEITRWEMEQLGILQITARGRRRFRILEQAVGSNQPKNLS